MRLAQAQRTLEGMLDRGTAFADAEEWINHLSLPADHLAALWLLAWSTQPQEEQRRHARQTLDLLHRAFA